MNRFESASLAKGQLAGLSGEQRRLALEILARLIDQSRQKLVSANAKDLEEQKGKISDSLYQRLKLDASKLEPVISGIHQLSEIEDPVGQVKWARELDSQLILEKTQVPVGVVGIIFESRPDVVPQILSLMLRTGNAVIFKGGAEAHHSQTAFMEIVAELNRQCSFLAPTWAQMLETRADVKSMLEAEGFVDLIIPRGSNELVRFVMENTEIPVLGHAEGICHIFVHASADQALAIRLIDDAKTQYPSACNSVETVLVEASMARAFLPQLADLAARKSLRIFGCEKTHEILPSSNFQVATEQSWRTEYGELSLNVRVVRDATEAIEHINRFGSHHTDAIIGRDVEAEKRFLTEVDSANVFANCSTRFSDGFRYGFGAEVGISTGKLPPRGPVGIEGLLTYKYILKGSGQIVGDYVGPQAKRFTHRDL